MLTLSVFSGMEMVPGQYFCSQKGLSVNVRTSLKYVKTEQITSLLYTIGPLQLTLSMLYVYVFAHFLSQSSAIPSGLYPSQALWPLKLQILSLSGCLFNSPPPFFFKLIAMEIYFPVHLLLC